MGKQANLTLPPPLKSDSPPFNIAIAGQGEMRYSQPAVADLPKDWPRGYTRTGSAPLGHTLFLKLRWANAMRLRDPILQRPHTDCFTTSKVGTLRSPADRKPNRFLSFGCHSGPSACQPTLDHIVCYFRHFVNSRMLTR